MAATIQPLVVKLHEFDLFSVRGVAILIAAIVGVQVIQALTKAIYNVYFHPLRKFPGPKLWIAFDITRTLRRMWGRYDMEILDQHLKHGEVIRIGENELCFVSPEAWKDIYGHGHAELPKYFPPDTADPKQILAALGSNHFRMRRAMLPAFSDKALGQQEPLMRVYIDLLMDRLAEVAQSGKSTNMVRWYNLTTFDLIADLAYGQSLEGLASGNSNRWINKIEAMMKLMPALLLMTSSPTIATLFKLLLGRKMQQSRKEHKEYAASLAINRIRGKEHADRGDFMDFMLRSRGKAHELTDDELVSNSDLFMIAGSETTATLLMGVTYWLLSTPHAYKRAQEEVQSVFSSPKDITFKEASAKLPYLLACLNEALRIFPSIPIVLFRQTLPGPPTTIAGHTIPPNTRVGVHQLSAYHTPLNFYDASSYHPERWLPEAYNNPSSPFYHDRRDAHKPFSFGPRDCIGRNLAYHEMRLILALILWKFDLELAPGMENWHQQKIYSLWEKPPLMVNFKLRRVE